MCSNIMTREIKQVPRASTLSSSGGPNKHTVYTSQTDSNVWEKIGIEEMSPAARFES